MASYTLQELATAYQVERTTMWRHIKKLTRRKKNRFKRTSIGRNFNEVDAARISKLLGFTLPEKKNK